MYKHNRYYNAGDNAYHRWGRKAQDRLKSYARANEAGWVSVPADGGDYWTFGTSEGRYGPFAKIGDTLFSVNKGGYVYAKAGTDKGDALIKGILEMVDAMKFDTTHDTDDEGFLKEEGGDEE